MLLLRAGLPRRFFTWAVAGQSFEQLILASRIAFIGWILGFIAGEVSNLISDYKRTKSLTHTLRRKR
ncbi:MAG: hypothetical protein IPJ48_17495 [Propionivibrio sp.]|uniref:Uncharacterized protein n=1 Tax=Candidatus Propionivibrio dominans TaxID=2954373 RepID=A0A9D7I8V1_9RHOO|nr:hypothetical protein [Candidatus Propionivibrio dominans]